MVSSWRWRVWLGVWKQWHVNSRHWPFFGPHLRITAGTLSSHRYFKVIFWCCTMYEAKVLNLTNTYFCSRRVQGDTARLESFVYPAGERYCFEFFYHMYGSSIGALNIYVKPISQGLLPSQKVWGESGNQGDMWRYGYVTATERNDDYQVQWSSSHPCFLVIAYRMCWKCPFLLYYVVV